MLLTFTIRDCYNESELYILFTEQSNTYVGLREREGEGKVRFTYCPSQNNAACMLLFREREEKERHFASLLVERSFGLLRQALNLPLEQSVGQAQSAACKVRAKFT